jgi:type IV secretory pathway VirB2 component (pilin)
MRRLKLIIIGLAVLGGVVFALAPLPAYAYDKSSDCNAAPAEEKAKCTNDKNVDKICSANPDSSICKDIVNPDPEKEVSNTVRNVINVLLFGIGVMAVISIIICGIRFASSHGDSSAVQKARTQLVYSVVGLVIAVLAFTIVNFVFARLGESGSGGGTTPTPVPARCASGQHRDPVTDLCIPDTP